MSEQLNECLSAAVDGEAEAFELRRVLDEAKQDPALAATWARYHLIGQGIRRELSVLPSQSSADAVWEACFPPEPSAPSVAAGVSAAGEATAAEVPWGGLAIAAAVVAVVGVLLIGGEEPGAERPALADSKEVGSALAAEGPRLPAQPVSAQDVRRANAYMLHHVQQRALNQTGVASFVKVATFDARD